MTDTERLQNARRLSRQELEEAYAARAAENGMTQSKAIAGGVGGGVGAALAEVLVLVAPQLAPGELALSVIFSAVLGAASVWLAPRNVLRN